MNNRELVALLAITQDALDELDKLNISEARRHLFKVGERVREHIEKTAREEKLLG